MPQRVRAPRIGTLMYEIGWKDDPPAGPIVVSFVYAGRRKDEAGSFWHVLVEFLRWWGLTRLGLPIEAKHGLKCRTAAQLYDGRKTWDDVRRWTVKTPPGPRPP